MIKQKAMDNIKLTEPWLENAQFICAKTDGKIIYNFTKFIFPLKFASKIHRRDLTLKEAEGDQQELKILKNKLNKTRKTTIQQVKLK